MTVPSSEKAFAKPVHKGKYCRSSPFISGLGKPGVGPEGALLTQCIIYPVLIFSGFYHWSALSSVLGLVMHGVGTAQG